ncbi:hypothetical protein PMZ80_005666 [Knufia obscura]|uniref:Uncharacterized protein n=1 Tax=Knufia obscura TaxID=1635080 RepID=A0ABR0RM84_9EURO|nr:hypothetical protein PMZ80_005666 [Knufia obscura]
MAAIQTQSTHPIVPSSTRPININRSKITMATPSSRKFILAHFDKEVDYQTEWSSYLKDKLAQTETQVTEAKVIMPSGPETETIVHKQTSISPTPSDLRLFRHEISRARAHHNASLAAHPHIDQIPIPPSVIVSESRIDPEDDGLARRTRQRREDLVLLRVSKGVGLREWEWSCGEPFDDDDEDESAVDDGEEGVNEVEEGSEGAFKGNRDESKSSTEQRRPSTYAKRRQAFTYTHGDDPIFRGRRIVLGCGRQRGLVALKGDWSDKVSEEDQRYVPDIKDLPNSINARAFLRDVTAGDLLTAPAQRDGSDDGRSRQDSGFSAMSGESSSEE